jgi:transposase
MPQILLPIFTPGLTFINPRVGFEKREGRIYYFHGLLPVFSHDESDLESFRFITSQLIVGGNVREIEIARTFGVSYISVKRNVKRLREQGAQGFFKPKKGRSAHILTPEVIAKAQRHLNSGHTIPEVAKRLNLKANTVRKAIQAGRLDKKKETKHRKADNFTDKEQA